jgi:class I fructose-bisphosphate aldolase
VSELGKQTRLRRIFSHPSGRILSVAVDHFIGYPGGLPEGLVDMATTLAGIVEGRPNAITMTKGVAKRFMSRHAGTVPMIIQQIAGRPDDVFFASQTTVEEVVALGADALACAITVNCKTESMQVRHLAKVTTEAERYGLPIIAHIYPLSADSDDNAVSNVPADVAFAVRVGLELGVDVIKVPYCGDPATLRDIVSVTPVPVVMAGGVKCETLEDAVAMVREAVGAGAAGATVGRNVWGFDDLPGALAALKQAAYEG